MLRYSLASLFLALLYLSIGCAALVNVVGVWPQVAVTLSVAILVLFSLGAIFWTERRQVFAIGFAATGWLYMLLVFSNVTNIRPYLLTESATNLLFEAIHGNRTPQFTLVHETITTGTGDTIRTQYRAMPSTFSAPASASISLYSDPTAQASGNGTYDLVVTGDPVVEPELFTNIGHSLWAVIVAFAGGITAQLLARSRKQSGGDASAEKSTA